MAVYLQKQYGNTATDVKESRITSNKKSGGFEYRLFKHNYFSTLQLFLNLCNRKINTCGTVCLNRNTFWPNILKLKKRGFTCMIHRHRYCVKKTRRKHVFMR
jgi:hypothetical protein